MKILKWFAGAIMFVFVSVFMLLTFLGFGQRQTETVEEPILESASEFDPELIPESFRDLILDIKGTGFYVMDTDNDNDREALFVTRLKEATIINGFPCGVERVEITQSGQLSDCTLAEDVIIQDNLIPQNARVVLWDRKNRSYAYFQYFSEDTAIQGYMTMSDVISNSLRIPVIFHTNGRLAAFWSRSNVEIQGIPCRRLNTGFVSRTNYARATDIYLNENGNLTRCTLSQGAEINGRRISAGSDIRISEDGEVTIINNNWDRRMNWITGFFN